MGGTWRGDEIESEKEKELGSRREKFRGSLQFNSQKYN